MTALASRSVDFSAPEVQSQVPKSAAPLGIRSYVNSMFDHDDLPMPGDADPIAQALARGEIPQELLEQYRVVPLESSEGRRFQEVMWKYSQPIIPEGESGVPKFLLCDVDVPNASYVTGSHPPIFMFTRAMYEGKGELAPILQSAIAQYWVSRHEFTHLEKRIEHGDDFENSVPEEMEAYALPLGKLVELGINPEPVLDVARALFNWQERERDILREIFDVHPVPENVMTGLKTELTKLRDRHGELATLKLPTDSKLLAAREAVLSFDPNVIREISSTARHTSYLTAVLAKHAGFAAASREQKLEILAHEFSALDAHYEVRLKEFAEHLYGLKSETVISAAERALIDRFADAVLVKYETDAIAKPSAVLLWNVLSRLADGRDDAMLPLGRLVKFAERAQNFIDAVKAGEDASMHQAGRQLLRACKTEALYQNLSSRKFLQLIELPTFALPDIDSCRVLDLAAGRRTQEDLAIKAERRFDGVDPSSPIQKPTVEWQPMRNKYGTDRVLLEAAIAIGLQVDPLINRALRNFPNRAIKHFDQIHGEMTGSSDYGEMHDMARVNVGFSTGASAERKVHTTHYGMEGVMSVSVSLKNLRLSDEGAVEFIVPNLDDIALSDAEGPRDLLPSVALADAERFDTIRVLADKAFAQINPQADKASAPEMKIRERIKRYAKILNRGRYDELHGIPSMRGKSYAPPLVALDHCFNDIQLFRSINQIALQQHAGADALISKVRDLYQKDPEKHRNYMRYIIGLHEGRVFGFPELTGYAGTLQEIENPFFGRSSRAILRAEAMDSAEAEGGEIAERAEELEEEDNREGLGGYVKNPYVQLVLDTTFDVFTPQERLAVIGGFEWSITGATVTRLERPRNAAAFIDLFRDAYTAAGKDALLRVENWDQLIEYVREPHAKQLFKDWYDEEKSKDRSVASTIDRAERALFVAVTTLLEQKSTPLLSQILEVGESLGANGLSIGDVIESVANERRTELGQLGSESDIKQAVWKLSTARKLKMFRLAEDHEPLRQVLDRLPREQDAAARLESIQAILSSGHIHEPKLRELGYRIFSETFVEINGTDDFSPEYSDKLFAAVEGALGEKRSEDLPTEFIRKLDAKVLFLAAAKECLAQKALCDRITEKSSDITDDQMKALVIGGRMADAGLEGARYEQTPRRAIVDFLCTPVSEASCDAVIKACPGAFGSNRGRVKQTAEDIRRDRSTAAILHANYWAVPEARILALQELLPPPMRRPGEVLEGLQERPDDIDDETLDYALSKIVSPEDKSDFAEGVRKFAKRYIQSRKPYERYAALALMLSGAQPSEERGVSLAAKAAGALEGAGPFEIKFGQKVPGHPSVEAEVGEPFERLTDRAAEPPRPEVVEETERRRLAIESVYTDYLRQKGRIGASEAVTIAYIGAVKGSASIAVTVHLRMSNGDELALSLKRLNALERAKVGYGHARETLESFISEGDSWQAALEIADQTAERLELETDYLIAGEQFKLGAKMFKGLHVEIDGEALSFTTPEVVGVDEDFFIMEFMPGSSLSSMFKEMQGRDPESVLRYKTGILAAHVYCIARCLFDYDRHFGQIIAMLQATFAELDFKATPLKPWSDESIEKFGKAIVHAGTGMFFGTPFRQAFRAAQKEQTKSGEKLDPIFGDLNLALVHLNRLVKELPPSAVARAVLSGFIAGVHPTLKQSILSNTSSELNSAVVSLLDPRSAGQNPLVEGLLEGKPLLKIWQDAAAA